MQYGSALVSHFAGFETLVQYGSALGLEDVRNEALVQ